MRRVLCLLLVLTLAAAAQNPPALLVLATVRQVRQLILKDALAPPTPAKLAEAAWNGARLPGAASDWAGFEKAFSRLGPDEAARAGDGALRAMMDSLRDPYSTVVTPAERRYEEQLQKSGSFTGVGVELAWRDGLVVVACLDGSPAQKGGVQPGDRILEVDGKSVQGLTYYAAGNLLLGAPGSRCRLVVGRGGQRQTLTLTRQSLRLPPVAGRMAAPGVGVVRVGYFSPETARQVQHELGVLARSGARRMILDLRGNPGGDFEGGVKTAGLFATGSLLLLEEQSGKSTLSSRSPAVWQGPLVILVDAGTASAGEIVAQSLQGRPNVTVMGRRTFGKARVQSFYSLPGGGGLHLTTGRYLSLGGHDLHGRGLEPDVAVPAGEDPLRRAIDQLSFIPVR